MARKLVLWCAVAAFVSAAGFARADVSPGDKITDANMDKVKDLVSPGMEWCIKRGWPITISETKRIEWPKAYKEATEKYSSQVKLAENGLSLQGYVAGAPFTKVDNADPKVAVKVMWNYEYRPYPGTDDFVEYVAAAAIQSSEGAQDSARNLAQLPER